MERTQGKFSDNGNWHNLIAVVRISSLVMVTMKMVMMLAIDCDDKNSGYKEDEVIAIMIGTVITIAISFVYYYDFFIHRYGRSKDRNDENDNNY